MGMKVTIRDIAQAAIEYAADLLAEQSHEKSAPDALFDMRHEVADWVVSAYEEYNISEEQGNASIRPDTERWTSSLREVSEALDRIYTVALSHYLPDRGEFEGSWGPIALAADNARRLLHSSLDFPEAMSVFMEVDRISRELEGVWEAIKDVQRALGEGAVRWREDE